MSRARLFAVVMVLTLSPALSQGRGGNAEALAQGRGSDATWTVSRLERDVPPEAARDVIQGAFESAFTPVAAERVKRRAATMWIKVKIERPPQTVEPPVLVLKHVRAARVTLFPPSGKPITQSLYGEEPSPRFTRDALYFPLGSSIRPGDTYYLHLDQLRSGAVAVSLQEMAAVNESNLAHMRIISLCIGAMLVMGITALLIWTWLPERGFLYLGGSMTIGSVYVALLLGDGYAWAGSAADSLVAFNGVQVAGALAVGFDILFFRELLDFGRYARRISALLKGLAIFFFADAALLFASGGDLQRMLTALGNLGTLAGWALIVPSMVVAAIRGSNVARLLFAAWAPTTIVTIPHVMTYLQGEPEKPWIFYGFPIALVVGFVLKACALGARLRLQRAGRSFVASEAPQDDHEAVLRRLRTACEHSAAVGPTTVIKVQVDDAKRIAAAHGEAVLRECLAKIRARIRHALRDDDSLGSVGPAEILVVMPGTDAKVAAAAAERIRRRVSESQVNFEGLSLAITVSVGLAWTQGVVEPDSLMAQAEAAAATADNAGGNRVVELPA